MTAQKRLLAEKSIQSIIAKCKEALAVYEATLLLYEDQLHPAQTVERLRREITSAATIEETLKLQSAIAKFQSEDAKLVAQNLRQLIIRDFDKAKTLLASLIAESLRILNNYKQAAIKAEREFFAEHDLSHEATTVSRQFNTALRELEHAKESLQPPQRYPGTVDRLPDARGTALTWFGIHDFV